MKESTIDILNKKLGEETLKITTGRASSFFSKDIFTTGERTKKEMEAIEHLIEEEGVEAFWERARKILSGEKKDAANAGTSSSVETIGTTRNDGECYKGLRETETKDSDSA